LHGALRESQEATRLAPNDSETHHTLGRILDFSGDVAGAISELRRAIGLEPQRAELHNDLGTVLVQDRTSRRGRGISEALRRSPIMHWAFHLGVLRYQEKSLEEASHTFNCGTI